MSSSQPGSLTPSPSASLEERITGTGEEGGEMGVRDEGKKRLKGKHRPLLFFFTRCFIFFPFFYTLAFSAWLPGCYNVKLAFLWVYREQCGTVTGRQEQRGRSWKGREEEMEGVKGAG